MSSPYKGRCLCGQIQYEVDVFPEDIAHCHCSMCRKFHGAAFAALASVNATDFRWIQGEASLQNYLADNGTVRQFCRNCGSSMTFASKNSDGSIIEIALGTLETPLVNPRPNAHIFTSTKVSWYDPQDDLPQFKEGRDSQRIK